MRFGFNATLLLAATLCLAGPAHGQIASSGPAALARQMPTVYGPYLANISRVRILQRRGSLRSAGSTRQSVPKTTPSTTSPGTNSSTPNTIFTPVQSPFVPQQLSGVLARTPEERKYIEGVLTKCLNFYLDTARQKGVPLNDVALALNYYISTNYFVYSKGSGPTQSQMNATRDMIRANLVQDERFRQMSDRQKQEAYETLIVLAGFVDLGYGTSKQSGNEENAAQFREMAKHNLETLLGVPVEQIHFTDNGPVLN
jgi:hypothetical protein